VTDLSTAHKQGGHAVKLPAIPKVTNAAAISAALDAIYDGHLSPATIRKLHAAGIKVNGFGCVDEAAVDGAGRERGDLEHRPGNLTREWAMKNAAADRAVVRLSRRRSVRRRARGRWLRSRRVCLRAGEGTEDQAGGEAEAEAACSACAYGVCA
jgi:hypothetical protein